MKTLDKIEKIKDELFSLYAQYIHDQFIPVFEKNPLLLYFHYAQHGKERYLSVNGIRWEDIDYFIHAIDFESSRHDDNPTIPATICTTLQTLPDFRAFRNASEDIYRVLADLTTQGVFSILVKGVYGFRLIATKDFVSYRDLGKEESSYYPVQSRD